MYRGVACYLEECAVDMGDEAAVANALDDLELELLPAKDADSDVVITSYSIHYTKLYDF